GTCKVLIKEGEVESTRTEKVAEEEYEQGVRQACQSRIITDLVVDIPVASRLETAILVQEAKMPSGIERAEAIATGWGFNPPLNKLFVALPPSTSKDNVSDLTRLLRGIKQRYHLSNISVDFDALRKLPRVLRKKDWQVTVTTLVTAVKTKAVRRKPLIINIESGNTGKKHYSLAFDIGTTTVCGQLLDLNRGNVIAEGITCNGQISYGADVITRIAYSQKPGGLRKLQQAVVSTINQIIDELLAQSRCDIDHIGHIIAAGNTTMTHILLGIDPKYIRLAPYTPSP
ncbi:unnamed protein product, partial [marine sediment metagenome]